ncbi:MAG: hypothetical protein ACJ74Y_14190 [Bryobacteraceae bacterium]|jgi:hypothetical protein
MIKRYILHLEFHKGYWPPIISFRRMPRHGDRMVDGGVPGTLIGCPTCSTTGFLHRPDQFPEFLKDLQEPIGDSQEIHGS